MRARYSSLVVIAILSMGCFASAMDWSNVDVGKAASGGMKLFKAAKGMSEADEIRLGRDVAAHLAARYGLLEDPAKLKYLNLVGQTVARRTRRTTLPFHFGILKSHEFNAFAAPGGYIFVTEGLLEGLQDEAELAGVLAHEVHHVTERHIVKAIQKANLFGAGKDLAAAVSEQAEAWDTLSNFSINLLDKGHSRTDELEADRLGTELVSRVGYDPRGLRDSVERLEKNRDKDGAFSRFNATHPKPADRLEAIDAVLKKIKTPAEAPRLADRFQRVFRRSDFSSAKL